MKKNNNLKEVYNKIAEDWNNDHSGDDWWIEGADIFLSLLPSGAKILDLGCGGGYKTKYIKDKGFTVEGIDFSESMIKIAKEKFLDINFKVVDVYNLDKYHKTFNGIFAQAVLLHIPKKRIIEVLKKIKSKLENNGLLYIAVKEIRDNGIEEEIRMEDDYGYEYKRFFSYFSLNELRDYFGKIGLKIVSEKVIKSGRTNWINIIGKRIK
jgi:SAM-dependent methyltransferase